MLLDSVQGKTNTQRTFSGGVSYIDTFLRQNGELDQATKTRLLTCTCQKL